MFGIELGQFDVEGKEFSAFVIGFLADKKFEELSLYWFLLIYCVEVGVEVFEGAEVLVFYFGLI